MTDKEAIEVLLKNVPKCCKMVDGSYQGGGNDWDCDMGQAIRIAVFALQEIQQYRELGTIEKIKLWIDLFGLDCFDELAVYRKIGTVEECRAAVEKQRARKPILDKIYYQQYYCPNCQDMVSRKYKSVPKYNFCHWCGQAIDWSEEE